MRAKTHNLNYKGCGTCAHASGKPGDTKFFCKLWDCNFLNTRSCEYYLRYDEPLNPFNPNQSPTEREKDLMHFRRYCHYESMTDQQLQKFREFHPNYVHQFNTGNTSLLLKSKINKHQYELRDL